MGNVIERMASECRFFANTLKEALVHPRSTSEIDKRTGHVVLRNGKGVADKGAKLSR